MQPNSKNNGRAILLVIVLVATALAILNAIVFSAAAMTANQGLVDTTLALMFVFIPMSAFGWAGIAWMKSRN